MLPAISFRNGLWPFALCRILSSRLAHAVVDCENFEGNAYEVAYQGASLTGEDPTRRYFHELKAPNQRTEEWLTPIDDCMKDVWEKLVWVTWSNHPSSSLKTGHLILTWPIRRVGSVCLGAIFPHFKRSFLAAFCTSLQSHSLFIGFLECQLVLLCTCTWWVSVHQLNGVNRHQVSRLSVAQCWSTLLGLVIDSCYSEVGRRPVAIYSLVQSRSERAKHSLRRRWIFTLTIRHDILNLKGVSLASYIDTQNAFLSVHNAALQLPIT
jgi:hypothetical protein